ncbi:alpha/beta hydrolase family protein [Ancylobacter sp. SL191]|uniref:alpha/beta hydrolase family protein n=1 Tax=Ancylobacter sp. SL191 TaxID=2995166 RepID=UPI00226EA2A0|nr:alpha/beta hydrolase [Ancylobacter sp. SL191]WAC28829.1 alpha/beta fold hydrolase [Ancylobacter sp. SL191]
MTTFPARPSTRRPHSRQVLALALLLAPLSGLPAAAQEASPLTSPAAPIPGHERLDIAAPLRGAPLKASVWYPTQGRTYRAPIGDNAVFIGAPAYMGAPYPAGKLPLVLLSHGSGGNIDSLSWLANGLVAQGFIVAGVNHPGSTSGDSSPRRSVRHWERAQDVRALLDGLLTDPELGPHIDTSRISVLGFSLGGVTAMTLAGARPDRDAFARYCAVPAEGKKDCLFFSKGGVAFDEVPKGPFEQDLRDPRISRVVAVDPAMAKVYTPDSLKGITVPVEVVSLGNPVWEAVDVGPTGGNFAAFIPHFVHETIAPADHYSFLALCKPAAPELLKAEGEDPICADPAGADRASVHQQVIARVARFLTAAAPGN